MTNITTEFTVKITAVCRRHSEAVTQEWVATEDNQGLAEVVAKSRHRKSKWGHVTDMDGAPFQLCPSCTEEFQVWLAGQSNEEVSVD